MAKIELSEYLNRIDALITDNSLEQATYHCYYLLRQFPKFLPIYKQIGRIFYETNQFHAAADIYLRILSVEPENFLNHLTMGLICENLHNQERAIYQTRAALFLQPENKEVLAIYQRMISSRRNFTEPTHYEPLLNGLHAFSEGKYERALDEFEKYQSHEYAVLHMLFCGLCHYSIGQSDKGAEKIETLLESAPWVSTALRKNSAYWHEKNPLRFNTYLTRLIELDPAFTAFTISENMLNPGKSSPIVTYQEWTGFQNSRLRTVWQQPGSKIIENTADEVPNWLRLIPISNQKGSASEEENQVTDITADDSSLLLFRTDRRQFLPEEDDFFQKDYFRAQVAENSSGIPNRKMVTSDHSKPVSILEKDDADGLDEAFDLLEKIASEGIEIGADDAGEKPVVEPVSSGAETEQEEKEPEVSSDEDQFLIRKAWNSFSIGAQDEGIRLYQELISKNIRPEQVQDDLNKLMILFPENDELKKIQLK